MVRCAYCGAEWQDGVGCPCLDKGKVADSGAFWGGEAGANYPYGMAYFEPKAGPSPLVLIMMERAEEVRARRKLKREAEAEGQGEEEGEP